ncbi:cold shock domain-containing protein [Cellvibrio sp. KY-GH-1]|uniref:cold-shock protein n=1 Tax=Cellvibrio sp. KY-GH-1 TaxID=2303332 RepID=UPI001243C174|nr:cold shock domain-containing protein [Cellvibrio sp. KY-GH-1]QEY16033.1 cold shock domain-containing protein [Cellvibrio sp. KY-GH-1]
MRTTVKNWFSEKGYGFLNNGSENAPDIMVHVSELRNCEYLKTGRTVEFECHINQRGLVAKNVKLIYDDAITSTKPYQNNSPVIPPYRPPHSRY